MPGNAMAKIYCPRCNESGLATSVKCCPYCLFDFEGYQRCPFCKSLGAIVDKTRRNTRTNEISAKGCHCMDCGRRWWQIWDGKEWEYHEASPPGPLD